MRRALAVFALVMFSTVCGSVARAQDECAWTNEGTWARYKTGKLRSLISGHSVPGMDAAQGIDLGSDPVKASVIYTGESRPTTADSASFISYWLKYAGHSEDAANFSTEFRFIEDGREHWLPVQTSLVTDLLKEVRKGESVDLLALWIGRTYPKGGVRRHVVVVNEFCKPRQVGAPMNAPPEGTRGDNTPFAARYVGGDRAPEVEVSNNADRVLHLKLGRRQYQIAPATNRRIVLEPGTYKFQATAPRTAMLEGEKEFERGYVYTWTFYIKKTPGTYTTGHGIIPRRRRGRRQ